MGACQAWVVRPRPRASCRLRLFCFPYAGGGASVFHSWHTGLPAEVDICAIQLPGREERIADQPYDRLSALIPSLADAMEPLLDRPFVIFGHSMGALIGFEFARSIRRRYGRQPAHLFVSGHRAPQLPDTEPPSFQLEDAQFLERLRRLNGTPEGVLENEELRRLVVSVMRADLSVCETYEYLPDAPLDCAISAFGGLTDPKIGRDELAPWQHQTTRNFVLRMLPGDHFFIRDVGSLLEAISFELRGYLEAPNAIHRRHPDDSDARRSPRASGATGW